MTDTPATQMTVVAADPDGLTAEGTVQAAWTAYTQQTEAALAESEQAIAEAIETRDDSWDAARSQYVAAQDAAQLRFGEALSGAIERYRGATDQARRQRDQAVTDALDWKSAR